MHLIMVPHLKLFSICSVTGLPLSSDNICHAPGLAQAGPHDAMHLPSYAEKNGSSAAAQHILQWFPPLCGVSSAGGLQLDDLLLP